MKLKPERNSRRTIQEQKINVESLWDPTIKELYKKRLQERIETNPITERDDINLAWGKMKHNIIPAAHEALGTNIEHWEHHNHTTSIDRSGTKQKN